MDSLGQPHVLVLDPDLSARVLLTAMLQRTGLRVTTCHLEREAAEHCLRRHRWAVVLLSSDMPNFASLLEELNAGTAPRRPKIIIATTSDSALPPVRADAVLLKPFQLNELYATLAACCSLCGDDGDRVQRHPRAAEAGR